MSVTYHTFHTVAEANAFVCGVNFANDPALDPQDIEVGTDNHNRPTATAVIFDEDEPEDTTLTIDHRDHT